MGNVFEGGADLTVLPCSAKPTWAKGVDKWIELYGIPSPRDLADRLSLSQLTPVAEFTGPKHITRFVAYGAGVFNDHTDAKVIRALGENIGRVTRERPEIRNVESVLFGTGAGGLDDATAAKALAKGFRKVAHPSARLCIFLYGHERHVAVQRALEGGVSARLKAAVILNPSIQGMGINLKKLFGWER
jgi:hypothetical protein